MYTSSKDSFSRLVNPSWKWPPANCELRARQMNYFATLTIKRPFRPPREQYIALFNPPGVMYVYDSEDAFYAGQRPNYAVKTSTMLVGAVFCTHDERWAFELPIAGLHCLGLRSSDEGLMRALWKRLREFQFIRYDAVDEVVQADSQNQ